MSLREHQRSSDAPAETSSVSSLTQAEWDKLWPLVESVAKSVARNNPGVDYDELLGRLSEFAVKATRPHLKHPMDPTNESGCKYLLFRAAKIEAAKLRAEAFANVSQYEYRTEDVKNILPWALGDPERWYQAPAPEDDDSIHKSDSHRVDGVLDVLGGLDRMDGPGINAIYERHMDGVVHPAHSAGRQRYNRAVERLMRHMNYNRREAEALDVLGHPGSRTAESNSASRARISRDAEFDNSTYDPINQGWS